MRKFIVTIFTINYENCHYRSRRNFWLAKGRFSYAKSTLTLIGLVLKMVSDGIASASSKTADDAYIPPLAWSAQLTDKLRASAETVGVFHRDCLAWLSRRSSLKKRLQICF